MYPKKAKVEAVKKFQVHKTKKYIRAILGLTDYFRKFIPILRDGHTTDGGDTEGCPGLGKGTEEMETAFEQLG